MLRNVAQSEPSISPQDYLTKLKIIFSNTQKSLKGMGVFTWAWNTYYEPRSCT
jgi:hypothetical protein